MDFDGHLVLCRHCAKRLMLALLGTRMPSCDHAIVPRDARRIWCCPASTRSSIDHVQASLFSHVVERFCPVTGASLIGNAPDCPYCLNCRFLFSAYAPLPVPEALLPITPLAPGCPYDLPWLRNARTEPDAAGKAQKTFASQNSSPYGFLVPPCPWSEPVRLPDHKEGHKGPHQVPRRSS